MKTILIAGGTGLIGKSLTAKLKEKGYQVRIFSRFPNKKSDFELFYWNPSLKEIDKSAFKDVDYVINLTGENISEKRWTKKQKLIIENSRIASTELLAETIKTNNFPVNVYISASAIGFYGTYTSEKIFKETDPPGEDWLAKVGVKWEKAVTGLNEIGIRTVILRTGVVFSKSGGAFPKLTNSLKFKSLATIGKGNQYIPWIHIDDLVSLYIYALENEQIKGIYNAVAPGFDTNSEIMKQIKVEYGKKLFTFKVPGIFLKILFGEMSSILLYGSRVSADKIIESGFEFQFPDSEKAIKHMINS